MPALLHFSLSRGPHPHSLMPRPASAFATARLAWPQALLTFSWARRSGARATERREGGRNMVWESVLGRPLSLACSRLSEPLEDLMALAGAQCTQPEGGI